MNTFLVVDDSTVSQHLVGKVLTKNFDATVVYAEDGVEAVGCLETGGPFDVILSDLRMPRMDGLGLLAVVRERFPSIPFVILTAYGSEEIAFLAIQGGAANYVPKRLVAKRLPEVVQTVLTASTRRQVRVRLAQHTISHELEYKLSNDRKLISAVVAELQEIGQASGAFDDQQLTRVGIALDEALTNAMIHGNLEIASELKAQADDQYEQTIRARQETPEYRDRRIHVRCRFTPQEVRFVIADEGPGFDVTAVPDPTDPQNLLKPSGRGLFLIRSFMDEVCHNSLGNAITMVKRNQPSATTAATVTVGRSV
jgi:CheY-like chemotaxis protein/anti-sigma regulatory factor (Ser/Thr protein kinase)